MPAGRGRRQSDVAVQPQGRAGAGKFVVSRNRSQARLPHESERGKEPRGKMEARQYDLIFICRPDTPEADVDKIIATLEHTAAEKGAKVEKVEKWGRKRMAYHVQRLRE